MRHIGPWTVLVAALVVGGAACDGDNPNQSSNTFRFTAQLSPANELSLVGSGEASGSGNVTIRLRVTRNSAGTITAATADFDVSLTGFPAATSLSMAHIHSGTAANNGPIVVDTGLTTGQVTLNNGAASFTRNGITLAADVAQSIASSASAFYFNVHTVLNPAGVVRGQLAPQ